MRVSQLTRFIETERRNIMKDILVVVKDTENQKLFKEALEEEYKVQICTDREQMRKILEHKIPDVLILEYDKVHFPVLEIIGNIKSKDELRRLPIVVISDGADEEIERKCMEIGVNDFIFRPCSKVGILSRTRRVLEVERLKSQIRQEINLKNAEEAEIWDLARRDPLTKLWNRVHTEKSINEFLKERRHSGALLMIDLDEFKEINDTYGHIVGDEILKEFSNTLIALTRENDIVCRLGGDEFIVFLKNVAYQSVVSEKIEQMIVTLEKRIILPEGKGQIRVSAGVALAPMDGRNFNELYQNADRALYYVKQNGKGSYHFYSEEGAHDTGSIKKKSTQVDLEHLRSFIQEMGYRKGAYQVEYDGFKKIYRFVARCIGRTGQDVQTLLFTLIKADGNSPTVTELVFAMDNLRDAVNESIRRGDVATNYSSSQFVVILMDSTIEDGLMVANRIVEKYNELHHYQPDVELHFDIQTVNAAPISDDF